MAKSKLLSKFKTEKAEEEGKELKETIKDVKLNIMEVSPIITYYS
jgi:hypothetical protein